MKKKVTAATLRAAKEQGQPMVWLTAYDAGSARIAEEAGVDVLLVGDSVGMVNLGYDSTIPVTTQDMILHTAAVVRGRKSAWVVCDLPFGSYQQSPEQALATSVQILQQTGCDAIKLEGGTHMAETVRFLSERGIAVVGHIGMTPQSVKHFGSFKTRGSDTDEAQSIYDDALAIAQAGAVALVLECIPADLAEKITDNIGIPTVGIGAGKACDAQVLVWHDVLGLSENTPPFAKPYANLREQAITAISAWADDVRDRT
ncbi:MAG: 3-methyl-2-oxobutanoate hydroxymethyltransferase [Zetaproteobacteria bacterium]|nr:MAG: 3-methyl-2-oxobutanoate hydroxymethyltransferase [Zetaproteobacteria bacterium]